MKYLQRLFQIPGLILKTITRVLSSLYIMIFRLLKKLFDKLKGKKKPKKKIHCYEVPIHIRRKPDPCLYSQQYIRTNFPDALITWNNPDIWFTEADGTEVTSRELLPDHQYTVHVRIHNASFDPAIGTSVRCYYRPFGFNWDQHLPVEVHPDGTEKVVILHIGAWANQIAKFNWVTPVGIGHLCLRAECRHIDDRNPLNNIGQENVSIIDVNAARLVSTASIFNYNTKENLRIFFTSDIYHIAEKQVELQLETYSQSFSKNSFFPKWNTKANNFRFGRQPSPVFTGYIYKGRNTVLKLNAGHDHALPPGIDILIGSVPLNEGLQLTPLEKKNLDIEFILTGEMPVSNMAVNINAFNAKNFKLIGGLTIFLSNKT